jgi:hypothetical protein
MVTGVWFAKERESVPAPASAGFARTALALNSRSALDDETRRPLEGRMDGGAMVIPEASSKVWSDIVSGRIKHQFKFMATRVMLGRIVPRVQREPATMLNGATELRELLAANVHLPSAHHDLQLICG